MKNLKIESFVLFGQFKFEDVKRVNTHSHININMQPQTTSYTDSIVVSINVCHKANMTEEAKKKSKYLKSLQDSLFYTGWNNG